MLSIDKKKSLEILIWFGKIKPILYFWDANVTSLLWIVIQGWDTLLMYIWPSFSISTWLFQFAETCLFPFVSKKLKIWYFFKWSSVQWYSRLVLTTTSTYLRFCSKLKKGTLLNHIWPNRTFLKKSFWIFFQGCFQYFYRENNNRNRAKVVKPLPWELFRPGYSG